MKAMRKLKVSGCINPALLIKMVIKLTVIFCQDATKSSSCVFQKAIGSAGKPTVINIDKSSSNTAALVEINNALPKSKRIKIRQNKHFNNIVEQGHRFIKRTTRTMLGFKSIHSAGISLSEIELHHMLRKGQHEALQNHYQFSSCFIH